MQSCFFFNKFIVKHYWTLKSKQPDNHTNINKEPKTQGTTLLWGVECVIWHLTLQQMHITFFELNSDPKCFQIWANCSLMIMLCVLMAWCFSTRTSETTVLTNTLLCSQCFSHLFKGQYLNSLGALYLTRHKVPCQIKAIDLAPVAFLWSQVTWFNKWSITYNVQEQYRIYCHKWTSTVHFVFVFQK